MQKNRGDAYHITQPHTDGRGAILAMKRALSQSSLHPNQVDYVNAHATSTPFGDAIEANVIKKCILRTCNIRCFGPILHKGNFWYFK
nr:3-oxoacyl-[acyl-carrier-protein] synthase, mitochondrial [Quercus suber]